MARINRRHFVGLMGGTLAALHTTRALAITGGFAPGIQLYAVHEPLATDTPGTLKRLAAIGYKEVETAGYGQSTAADYRRFCDDAGLKIPSAHVNFAGAADLGPLFADTNTLGAHYAVSSYFIDRPQGTDRSASIGIDAFKRTAARMNEFGRAAKAAGLQYAYHNHNHEFEKLPDGGSGFDLLLRETDASLVKFEIDCGWMIVAGGDPLHYFKAYPGRFRMLHIKDFLPQKPTTSISGAGRPQGAELGHGFIRYHNIIAAARPAGIEHIFAEQEAPYVRPQLESAKVSYDYLETL
jgi:sugar phosphate isomerase/epimerase